MCYQAFTEEDLDPSIDFTTGDTEKTPKWIEGRGQRVYWHGCYGTAYEKDSTGKRGDGVSLKKRDGQGTVPSNVELYFAGEGGKLKEA